MADQLGPDKMGADLSSNVTLACALVLASISCTILYIYGHDMARLLTNSSDVIELADQIVRLFSLMLMENAADAISQIPIVDLLSPS